MRDIIFIKIKEKIKLMKILNQSATYIPLGLAYPILVEKTEGRIK